MTSANTMHVELRLEAFLGVAYISKMQNHQDVWKLERNSYSDGVNGQSLSAMLIQV